MLGSRPAIGLCINSVQVRAYAVSHGGCMNRNLFVQISSRRSKYRKMIRSESLRMLSTHVDTDGMGIPVLAATRDATALKAVCDI